MSEHHFRCPQCGLACKLNETTRGINHQQPNCDLFAKLAREKNLQEFLRLALMAIDKPKLKPGSAALREPTTEKEKLDLIDQLNEGFKKL